MLKRSTTLAKAEAKVAKAMAALQKVREREERKAALKRKWTATNSSVPHPPLLRVQFDISLVFIPDPSSKKAGRKGARKERKVAKEVEEGEDEREEDEQEEDEQEEDEQEEDEQEEDEEDKEDGEREDREVDDEEDREGDDERDELEDDLEDEEPVKFQLTSRTEKGKAKARNVDELEDDDEEDKSDEEDERVEPVKTQPALPGTSQRFIPSYFLLIFRFPFFFSANTLYSKKRKCLEEMTSQVRTQPAAPGTLHCFISY